MDQLSANGQHRVPADVESEGSPPETPGKRPLCRGEGTPRPGEDPRPPRPRGGDGPPADLSDRRREEVRSEAAGPLADLRARRSPVPRDRGAELPRRSIRGETRRRWRDVPRGRIRCQGPRLEEVLSVLDRAGVRPARPRDWRERPVARRRDSEG